MSPTCPLLVIEGTSVGGVMSALPPKADIETLDENINLRFGLRPIDPNITKLFWPVN
jgi:hypothetical protein